MRRPTEVLERGLRPAERFVDDFFWSRWRLEVGVFDLFCVGRGEGIDQTVEWGKVALIGALDGVLDAVITRDQNRIGSPHVGEVRGGAGFATPCGEPSSKGLVAGKHRRQRSRILSASDPREAAEEEGEIDRVSAE
jgi:hypothetical protein